MGLPGLGRRRFLRGEGRVAVADRWSVMCVRQAPPVTVDMPALLKRLNDERDGACDVVVGNLVGKHVKQRQRVHAREPACESNRRQPSTFRRMVMSSAPHDPFDGYDVFPPLTHGRDGR